MTNGLLIAVIPLFLMPQATQDQLVAPMPDGFVVGFSTSAAGMAIEERISKGETVQDWTRMVTLQRFVGIGSTGPKILLEKLGQAMAAACPGARIGTITEGEVPEIASIRVDCPRNPATGKPETMFAKGFGGTTDLLIVQYAFRAEIDAAREAEASTYLSSIGFCRMGMDCTGG